jgi:hypothetical protein
VQVTDATNGLGFPRLDCMQALAAIGVGTCATGSDCGDGDPCTSDVCDPADAAADLRGCVHGAVPGATCAATCPAAPLAGCRPPAFAGKSLVKLRTTTPSSRDFLLWKWVKGTATSLADFGDPVAATTYQLCAYAEPDQLVAHGTASIGSTCGPSDTEACWRATGAGFTYVDRKPSGGGPEKIVLRSGVDGKARIVVKARGEALDAAVPPLTLPVRVQLKSADGVCWEATYSTALKNEPSYFKARGD